MKVAIVRFLFLLAPLPLCACIEDQVRQHAECELQYRKAPPAKGEDGTVNNDIGFCMRAKGYVANINECDDEHVPYCFIPANWTGRMLYKLERMF